MQGISREAEDLIRRLLVMNPARRLGCGTVTSPRGSVALSAGEAKQQSAAAADQSWGDGSAAGAAAAASAASAAAGTRADGAPVVEIAHEDIHVSISAGEEEVLQLARLQLRIGGRLARRRVWRKRV